MLRSPRSADAKLVAALRRGEEHAFAELVARHHNSLVRVAEVYVRDRSVAEELAQDTWLIVLESLDGFEGRASLRTWIFSILINRSKTRGAREQRNVPMAALTQDAGPAVPAGRFLAPDDPEYPRHWSMPPEPWPEERLLMRETMQIVREAVHALAPAQQVVLGLRDVDGWSSKEVCAALEITPGNERVLLHRARARIRAALESYLEAP